MSGASRFVELPVAPVTGSHVPELTSIHSVKGRGPYGDSRYRGNCSGYLIRDLLRYYQPKPVLDLMQGSGTCGDVCRELGLPFAEMDIKLGQDAADPASYAEIGDVGFAWAHPPYWRMISYSSNPNCLSQLPTLDSFLDRMQLILRLTKSVLAPNGKIAILIRRLQRSRPLSAVTAATCRTSNP